jgi:septum formation protein
MQKKIVDPLLILASSSPRRKDLLKKAGLIFSVVPSSFDEQSVSIGSHEEYVRFLAKEKTAEVSKTYPDKWVLGADTIVVCLDERLEKPKSDKDAKRILNLLSGKKHQVITGYAMSCTAENTVFSEAVTTDVYFKCLTEKEIQWYINTREPFGKAGAYAIQGKGSRFVKAIDGSYTNVVGLPVYEVIEFLLSKKVIQ